MLVKLVPATMPGGEGLFRVDSGLRPVLQMLLACEGMPRTVYHHAEHMDTPDIVSPLKLATFAFCVAHENATVRDRVWTHVITLPLAPLPLLGSVFSCGRDARGVWPAAPAR